ncbi:MAG: hypothetical protein Q9M30_07515 [Mariprofundaceae bacterium]|nr:hypothetical protein [Mariprofundaceae bacterium]
MKSSDTMIVRITLPNRSVVRVQGLLMGMDGLATMRGQAGGTGELELWSTWAQEDELDDWLASMPAALEMKLVGRYAFESAE